MKNAETDNIRFNYRLTIKTIKCVVCAKSSEYLGKDNVFKVSVIIGFFLCKYRVLSSCTVLKMIGMLFCNQCTVKVLAIAFTFKIHEPTINLQVLKKCLILQFSIETMKFIQNSQLFGFMHNVNNVQMTNIFVIIIKIIGRTGYVAKYI